MGAKLAMGENRKAPVPVLRGNFFLTPLRLKVSKPKCEWDKHNWKHLISRGNGRGKRSWHWSTDHSSWLCTAGEWRSNWFLPVLNFRHTHVFWTLCHLEITVCLHEIPLCNTINISTLLWAVIDKGVWVIFVDGCKRVTYPPFCHPLWYHGWHRFRAFSAISTFNSNWNTTESGMCIVVKSFHTSSAAFLDFWWLTRL